MEKRKIRMGMVGGGPGSFIALVHYNGAVLDGQIELVCGAFSSDPEKSKIAGKQYFLPPERVYSSYAEMFEKEKTLAPDERMDFVCIATPNHVHYDPARLALENGFHVVIDKPLTFNVVEAEKLAELVEKTGLVFAVTHAYTAYPMIKEARKLIADGHLGKIRKIVVEYPQGWLSTPLEKGDSVQASWRTDPTRSGKAGCMGDIGTHAFNLAEYVSGEKVSHLCADLTTFVEGRKLDDDGNVLLRFENGAKGVLHASQISAGEENNLNIRVYGEKGGIEWHQVEPNTLKVKWLDKPTEIRKPGNSYVSGVAAYHSRLPFGHPEGLIEAFANIYRNVATSIQCRLLGEDIPEFAIDYPGVQDGLRGMKFIDALIESNSTEVKWTRF
ncbi:MAG: Gfo/Idh/MocA family oxidoreductase [Bacteroidales bacterium]|nr:Gfo/Idh/MocA family oxidoreductase [Bacteroidales bacterium]